MSLVDLLRAGRRLSVPETVSRLAILRLALLAVLHLTALVLLVVTEAEILPRIIFLLAWGLLNFVWLLLLRRPILSAALSLALLAGLIALSQLKYVLLWQTVSFVDVVIIDYDSLAYLFAVVPDLYRNVLLICAIALALLLVIARLDTLRISRRLAMTGTTVCLAGLTLISWTWPLENWEIFMRNGHVSKFARTGVAAITELVVHGMLQSEALAAGHLRSLPPGEACAPPSKPPNIILVHDESSFDITVAPGMKVPPGYRDHFRSFDGRQRHFVVEGPGGPSWYAEYNVLSGLSARSFGQFSYFVTRIAAGRVHRGLAQSLRHCGYRTLSIYPALGAFMSAKSFQTTAGVQRFLDSRDLGTNRIEPDQFFYDKAVKLIGREDRRSPLFMYIYLSANHYPWEHRFRPDLMPDWRDLGNEPRVDEYLRRQTMSAQDYRQFLARLKQEFPGEPFLIVRYGDHQPEFAAEVIELNVPDAELTRRFVAYDPRYYTTYYALDAVNYKPANLSSAIDTLEGAYLPMVIQEAAGLPLDPSFAEQKRIFQRCNGAFFLCQGGAEARRFNRLLIDAGLIKGL